MKNNRIIVIASLLLLAVSIRAQQQTEQPPPPPLGDTISGWKVVFSNPDYGIGGRSISQLMFPSHDTGYATAYNGVKAILLRTIDAGITWDSLPTPPPVGYLTFTSTSIGYGTISSNVVYKTIDGGLSWQPHDRNSIGFGPIVFSSKDTGMVLGANEYSRTTNGGETWTKLFGPVGIDKFDASFANSTVGYAVGSKSGFPDHPEYPDAGYCEKTTDAGATWRPIYTGLPHYLWCCQALDANTLIVGGQHVLLEQLTVVLLGKALQHLMK